MPGLPTEIAGITPASIESAVTTPFGAATEAIKPLNVQMATSIDTSTKAPDLAHAAIGDLAKWKLDVPPVPDASEKPSGLVDAKGNPLVRTEQAPLAPQPVENPKPADTNTTFLDSLPPHARAKVEAATAAQAAASKEAPVEPPPATESTGAGQTTDVAAPGETVRQGAATWKSKDSDLPVKVLGSYGKGPDGREYVKIEGYGAGIPLDEIQFPTQPATEAAPVTSDGSATVTAEQPASGIPTEEERQALNAAAEKKWTAAVDQDAAEITAFWTTLSPEQKSSDPQLDVLLNDYKGDVDKYVKYLRDTSQGGDKAQKERQVNKQLSGIKQGIIAGIGEDEAQQILESWGLREKPDVATATGGGGANTERIMGTMNPDNTAQGRQAADVDAGRVDQATVDQQNRDRMAATQEAANQLILETARKGGYLTPEQRAMLPQLNTSGESFPPPTKEARRTDLQNRFDTDPRSLTGAEYVELQKLKVKPNAERQNKLKEKIDLGEASEDEYEEWKRLEKGEAIDPQQELDRLDQEWRTAAESGKNPADAMIEYYNKQAAMDGDEPLSENEQKEFKKYMTEIYKDVDMTTPEGKNSRKIKEKFMELGKIEAQLVALKAMIETMKKDEKKMKTDVDKAEGSYLSEKDPQEKMKKMNEWRTKALRLEGYQIAINGQAAKGRELNIRRRKAAGFIHRKLGSKTSVGANIAFGAVTAYHQTVDAFATVSVDLVRDRFA